MAAPDSSINNYELHYSVNVKGKNVAGRTMSYIIANSFFYLFQARGYIAKVLFQLCPAGTKNVIDACIELKVKRLVYTSSPTVVFDGIHGIFNGDESLPYPTKVIHEFFEAAK